MLDRQDWDPTLRDRNRNAHDLLSERTHATYHYAVRVTGRAAGNALIFASFCAEPDPFCLDEKNLVHPCVTIIYK